MRAQGLTLAQLTDQIADKRKREELRQLPLPDVFAIAWPTIATRVGSLRIVAEIQSLEDLMEQLGVFSRKLSPKHQKLGPVLEALGTLGLLRLLRNLSQSSPPRAPPVPVELPAAIDRLIVRVMEVGGSGGSKSLEGAEDLAPA